MGWSRSENLSTSTVDEASLEVSTWLRHAKRELAVRSDNGVKELEAEEGDVRAELEQLRMHADELHEAIAELRG